MRVWKTCPKSHLIPQLPLLSSDASFPYSLITDVLSVLCVPDVLESLATQTRVSPQSLPCQSPAMATSPDAGKVRPWGSEILQWGRRGSGGTREITLSKDSGPSWVNEVSDRGEKEELPQQRWPCGSAYANASGGGALRQAWVTVSERGGQGAGRDRAEQQDLAHLVRDLGFHPWSYGEHPKRGEEWGLPWDQDSPIYILK